MPVIIGPHELYALHPPLAEVRICHRHYYCRLINNEWIMLFDFWNFAFQES